MTIRLGSVIERPQYGLSLAGDAGATGTRLVRITDLQDHAIDWSGVPGCEVEGSLLERYSLQDGDLLVARIGATTGKAVIIRQPPRAVYASYLLRVRSNGKVDPQYLAFFFRSSHYWSQIASAKGGRLKGGVTIPNLEGLTLRLPPIAEQRTIASLLSRIEEAVHRQERLISALGAVKSALARSVSANGATFLLASVLASDPQNGLYRPSADYGSGTPIVRIDAFDSSGRFHGELRRVRMPADEAVSFALRESDILVNRVNSLSHLGKSMLVPKLTELTVFESNMMRLQVDEAKASARLIVEFLNSPAGKQQFLAAAKRAVAQSSVNQGDVLSFAISLPPLGEQPAWSAAFSALDASRDLAEKRLKCQRQLFDGVLESAMNGDLGPEMLHRWSNLPDVGTGRDAR